MHWEIGSFQKNISIMVTYVIVLFFFFFPLAIWRKSYLSPAQREKHLATWGKDRTCYICGFTQGKEELFKKARHAEYI